MASEKRPLIRVIGSINVDFTTNTPRFPGPGETLTATSLSVNAGGKGANQAVACGRASFTTKETQDVSVEMIGAVGQCDPYYQSLIEPTLKEAGVASHGITEVKGQTGTATIIVDDGSEGENRILVVPGANHEGMRQVDEITARAFEEPLPAVIVMQGEIPQETVFAILDYPKSHTHARDTKIILNPAPVFDGGIPLEHLSQVDVLIMNETEMGQVVHKLHAALYPSSESAPWALPGKGDPKIDQTSLDHITKLLHRAKVKVVIVTLGPNGVFYSTISSSSGLIPGMKVPRVVDTTAAGDTFVGHFAAALARWIGDLEDSKADSLRELRHFPIRNAIVRANEISAKCVQRRGAMQSIPWGYE